MEASAAAASTPDPHLGENLFDALSDEEFAALKTDSIEEDERYAEVARKRIEYWAAHALPDERAS